MRLYTAVFQCRKTGNSQFEPGRLVHEIFQPFFWSSETTHLRKCAVRVRGRMRHTSTTSLTNLVHLSWEDPLWSDRFRKLPSAVFGTIGHDQPNSRQHSRNPAGR